MSSLSCTEESLNGNSVILTRPSATSLSGLLPFSPWQKTLWRDIGRAGRDIVKRRQRSVFPLGGHTAVTHSLVRGLRDSNIWIPTNPSTLKGCRLSQIGVLSGRITLAWANAYASSHPGVELVVGPNVFVTPRSQLEDLLAPTVKRIIVPSHWVKEFYAAEEPHIRDLVHIWYAGVDTEFWAPNSGDQSTRQSCLIYVKNTDESVVVPVSRYLESHGFGTKILHYGRYSPHQYRRVLADVSAVVVLGGYESQGIAMFEAWSMDKPTFVRVDESRRPKIVPKLEHLDPEQFFCPYLSESTGAFWRNLDELMHLMFTTRMHIRDPRGWVLENARQGQTAIRYVDLLRQPRSV